MPMRDPPARRGDRLSASRINNIEGRVRSAGFVAGPDVLLSGGRSGVSAEFAPEGGNRIGVITTTVTACTGTSPNFTWGVGEALLLDVSASGSTSTGVTVAVYSTVLTELVASNLPVQLKDVDGLLFVDVKDCP